MNEIALSNNLAQIELEINHHKQIAGQSIWEIGRRLNHVKEHDLAHGQFMSWYQRIGLDKDFVSKSMKIAKELPNFETFRNLGATALHLIATLPAEAQTEQIQRIEAGNAPTVAELKHVKAKYSKAVRRIEELESQQLVKEIVKEVEVAPPDYQQAIQKSKDLAEHIKAYADRNAFLEKTLNDLHAQRAEVDEKSAKYDELTEAIRQSQGKLNEAQAKIGDYNHMLNYLRKGNELLTSLGGIPLIDERKWLKTDARLKNEFEMLADGLNHLTKQVNKMLNDTEIIEGEIL